MGECWHDKSVVLKQAKKVALQIFMHQDAIKRDLDKLKKWAM